MKHSLYNTPYLYETFSKLTNTYRNTRHCILLSVLILSIPSTWHEFWNLIGIHSNVWQRSHFNIIKWVFHGLLHPNHIQVLDNGIHPKEPTIHFVYRKNRQAKTIKMRRHLKWWKMNWRHNIVYIETSLHSQLESTHTLLDLHATKNADVCDFP